MPHSKSAAITDLNCKKKTVLARRVKAGGGSATYVSGKNKGSVKRKGGLIAWLRAHPAGIKKKAKKAKTPKPKPRTKKASAKDKKFLKALGYSLK